MNDPLSFEALPTASKQLVSTMPRLDFRTFENPMVHAGEPTFDPPPQIARTVKFKAIADEPRTRSRGEIRNQTFLLIQELLRLGDGKTRRLEVQAGSPFRMIVEDSNKVGSDD